MPNAPARRPFLKRLFGGMLIVLLGLCMAAPSLTARQEKVPLSVIHPALQRLMETRPDFRVPVIVQKVDQRAKSDEIARSAGGEVDEEFAFIHAFRMTVPARALRGLSQVRGVRYISPDGPVTMGAVDTSTLQPAYPWVTGAASLWNAGTGLTGSGVTVAVVDSGVAEHPDFGSRVQLRWAAKTSNLTDVNGHGTHVAGIIAGRSPDGTYIGVAPDAAILALKTTNDRNYTSEAGVVKALQWVYENRNTYNIRVVNMSISAQTPNSYLFSPMAAAAEKLWQSGIVVVVAAGNRGWGTGVMWYPPGNDPFLLTVGALDDNQTASTADDSLSTFSSYGLTQNLTAKPDLVAPGRRIVAPLASTTSVLAKALPDRISPDGKYIRLSGTSMATPVVSGLVALLLERYPDLTPNQVKWSLTSTTVPYPGQPAGTAGMVNLPGALDLVAQRRSAGQPVGEANTGLIANPQVSLLANNVNWEATDWTQVTAEMYSSSGYWDAGYWDAGYWDAGYWDAGYWEAGYWDSYYSESTYLDDTGAMTWD
ncbi:MAG TPA: S8 family peptidase [Symbiobacteriaceae bacterium]|nr:S8 family peptidase [Symbiobacteriaceae bacterium]